MKFLKSFEIKMLIQGNFKKSQAMEITQNVVRNLNQESFVAKEPKVVKSYQLPVGSTSLVVKSLLPNDKNSVIKTYYQIGEASTEAKCLVELLTKVMREPLFNFIRTQKQLGYSVICSSKLDHQMLGFTITVESQEKRHSSWNVENNFENFIKNFSSVLEEMSENDFETLKQSIIAQKRSPDIDLETEAAKNWIEIRENKFEFERNDIETRQLELLRKNDLTIFFNDHFTSESMRKLSIHVISNADDGDDLLLQHGFIHLDLITDDTHNTIKNIAQFKNSLAASAHF